MSQEPLGKDAALRALNCTDVDAVMTRILTDFVACSHEGVDERIVRSLEEICRLNGADCAFLIGIEPDPPVFSVTHRWEAPGCPSVAARYQSVPLAASPWSVARLQAGEVIRIGVPDDYPPEASNERRNLEQDGAVSQSIVPIRGHGSTLAGCLGFRSYTHTTSWDWVEGPILRMVGEAMMNVLERRRTEEVLRRERALFRTIIDNIPEPIYAKDLRCRKTVANLSDVRNIGAASEADVLNKDDFDLFPREKAARFHAVDQSVLETGKPVIDIEDCFQGPGGEAVWLLSSKIPLKDADGKTVGLVGIAKDITERKRLEEQLRQAQKMEAIGHLAGGVAHDFNNILAAIMMNIGLLQESPSLSPEVREGLGELELEAKRAASLTRQLLMFSRRSVMDMRILDLNTVVANLLKMLSRVLGENIVLGFEPSHATPWVEADAGMLEQVLMNLTVNARDAMPKGGTITFAIRHVEITADAAQAIPERRTGRFACLSVADNGCGMDAAILARIFEPFFTTKEVGKGTGLGLATVHGIVAQHNGWVEVESQVGHGTTFRIHIPSAPEGSEKVATEPQGVAPRGTERILVVEDDAAVRRFLIRTLRSLGYSVVEASSGREAMRFWATHGSEVNLLLTDLVMPDGISGLDLVQQLRALKPGLRVVVTSGYSEEMANIGRLETQDILFLPKPYEVVSVGRVIRECLDRGAR